MLRITVILADADRGPTPVPRHALLVSDTPPSAPPRRIVTAPDGTVTVRLRAGTYTVESDRPVVVQHTRLDSRQAENALLSTMAFPDPGPR